jgi:hypothetical protein
MDVVRVLVCHAKLQPPHFDAAESTATNIMSHVCRFSLEIRLVSMVDLSGVCGETRHINGILESFEGNVEQVKLFTEHLPIQKAMLDHTHAPSTSQPQYCRTDAIISGQGSSPRALDASLGGVIRSRLILSCYGV